MMTIQKTCMTAFKKIFLILAAIGVILPSFAFAAFGLEGASQGTGLIKAGQTVDAKTEIPNLIGNIVAVALSFVGAIFFLLILYAGFLWMTAFGSSEKVDKAKDILQHAMAGLLIVLAAYAISKFVFSALTSATGGSSNSTTNVPGSRCVPNGDLNNVWDSTGSNCITKCEYTYPGNGQCMDKSACLAPKTTQTFLCPGADPNFLCCKS